MASLTTQRVGNSISWSLQFATRSRSIAFTFASLKRSRRHRRHLQSRSQHHPFSTTSPFFQQTPAPSNTASSPTAKPPAPAKPASRFPAKPHEPPPPTARNVSANQPQEPLRDISKEGFADELSQASGDGETEQIDWTRSYQGLSEQPFSKEAAAVLLQPLDPDDIEIKPDGIVYLPEIKYRRILNRAFGPGGWGLAPRGETIVTGKCVTREYALLAGGRLVSVARGEQDYFDNDGIPTATEGCKSNALMRCCKDLGIASELWDPRFIRKHLAQHAKEVWVEHMVNKKRKKITMRKDDEPRYPFKEVKSGASGVF